MLTETELQEQFSKLSNWQDRYRHIITLSKSISSLSEEDKKDDLQIQGCENKVWLTYHKHADQTLTFYGDSEGRIVKGLLAILLIIANGKTANQLMNIDFINHLQRLKILDELSASRQLGLKNIINKIQSIAKDN